jgi:hypothetical protein
MYNMQNVFFSYFRTLLLFVRIHILTVPRWKWTCFFPAKQYIYNTYLSKWSFMSLLSTTILGSLLRLIALQNRSQLLYPSDSFVGIIENCEYNTKTVRYHFYNMRNHVLICMTCCMITSFKIQRFPVQTTKLQYAMLLLKQLRNQSLVIFL